MIIRTTTMAFASAVLAGSALAQDWSQWRGENRDARASGFKTPATWPKQLTQKWKVTVGEGVASPAVVGDKVYVFSRQDGNEVLRSLKPRDGSEVWVDRYEALGASGPAQSFSGPRSSPAVAKGKVVTLGVRGMVSGVDATTGKTLWRKDDFKKYPNFHPSSSPLILDGLAIAQLGGRENGALVAYDLGTGDEKWKWNGPSPSYSSPVLASVGTARLVVAHTEAGLVAVNAADGTLAWELPSAPAGGPGGGGPGEGGRGRGGGGRDYKAATPLVDGQTVIIAGRGIKAIKLANDGGKIVGKEVWNNPDKSVQFASPTLKDGLIYALSGNNELFCLKATDGSVAWTAQFPGTTPPVGPGGPGGPGGGPRAVLPESMRLNYVAGVMGQAAPAAPGEPGERPRREGGPGGPDGGPRGPGGSGGPGGGFGGRGRGGGGGYGTIVDAGSVLFALTPTAQLIVFEPGAKEFKLLASYKVAEGQTHSYPVISGNRIFIKDKETLTLWTVE